MQGVSLSILHPEIVSMDCGLCEKFRTDDNWNFTKGRDGKRELRLVNCGDDFKAPCRNPKKGCPKGTPDNPRTLSSDNELCYEHFKECRAVNQFPDDPIVRRNAAIISEAERLAEKQRIDNERDELIRAIAGK